LVLFAYPTLEAATVTIWNQLPPLLSDASFNAVGGEVGFGGCESAPCTSSSDAAVGRLASHKLGQSYMTPVLVLFVQGLMLRFVAGTLLCWTARDQQIKPRLSEYVRSLFGCNRRKEIQGKPRETERAEKEGERHEEGGWVGGTTGVHTTEV
jgi:hypothetical protein